MSRKTIRDLIRVRTWRWKVDFNPVPPSDWIRVFLTVSDLAHRQYLDVRQKDQVSVFDVSSDMIETGKGSTNLMESRSKFPRSNVECLSMLLSIQQGRAAAELNMPSISSRPDMLLVILLGDTDRITEKEAMKAQACCLGDRRDTTWKPRRKRL